jgi:hypothetical protein
LSEFVCPKCGAKLTVAAKLEQPKKAMTVEDARTLFPSDLEAMLSFEEKEGSIIIKPRQFLGSDNFAKIASIVRSAGGEYISAGKESHFRIPK